MTNFEKIKSMDIVELSKFIDKNSGCLDCIAFQICDDFPDLLCVDIIEKWLKMEVEPVHAKWLLYDDKYECSNCGFILEDNSSNCCPDCEAKMEV